MNFKKQFLFLRKVIFIVFLFFLPSQLGRHFWPDFAFISGIRVDHLSPTIYLTDILIFLLILASVFDKKRGCRSGDETSFKPGLKISDKPGLAVYGMLLLLFFAFNIILALNPQIAFLKALQIIKLVILALLVGRNWQDLSFYQKITPLLLITLVEFFLSLGQITTGRSLQGVFYFLGERRFALSTPGIARASLFGRQILRPYGTFSHPNSLAAFYLPLFFLILHEGYKSYRFAKTQAGLGLDPGSTKPGLKEVPQARLEEHSVPDRLPVGRQGRICPGLACQHFIVGTLLSLSLALIILSGSQAAWLTGALVGTFYLAMRGFNSRHSESRQSRTKNLAISSLVERERKYGFPLTIFTILFLLFILLNIIVPAYLTYNLGQQIFNRLVLNQQALKLILKYPLGTGLNNYLLAAKDFLLSDRSLFLQPAHNIYLLFLAETGVFGFLLLIVLAKRFSILIQKLFVKKQIFLSLALLSIIMLGLFDHAFYTLQQNQLIAALIIGIALGKTENRRVENKN